MTQIKLLEMKITMIEKKKTLDQINGRLDTDKENIHLTIKTLQNETQKILEKQWPNFFSNLMKTVNPQILEA